MSDAPQGTAPRVSVVVPLLDEEATVDELVDRTAAVLAERGAPFELVIVDDGSGDGTLARLREREAELPQLRVFSLTRNFGQAAALACGLFAARGDVVVSMDGDLQNPPEEIPRLLDAIDKGAGVATARRAARYEPFWRWLGSRAVHALARLLTGARIEDVGGQFKAYRREVIEAARELWAPGKPFFPLTLWLGYPVTEVSVRHEPRREGRSRYGFLGLVRVNLDLITSFTTVPLLALGALGAAGLVLGGAGVLACLWLAPEGWLAPAFALTTFALGGVFAAAGVLGLYLARIYKRVSGGDPGFVVRQGPLRDGPTEGAR
ncbi:MAG TPA: glycosyltransferase family 2 protein [Myxococcota bacterium]|nr:glycosyltransferase family 2 protein [Myxococcota bacterium]